ncbi:hypothetical protein A0H81_09137 [Grifola frondosa]|uniref:Smr domain-containing protein n=1 Tax=Grifola frondosa TaxID=5627 RepID=A0A1C7M237_GRIFR|nr:hypothetical protein A0H81_09137 [Grifola frondosa]
MSETADLVSGEMQGNEDTIDPPPSYEQTPGETADETRHADANVVPDVSPDSNITGAQGLRKHADEEEAWLEVEHQEEADYYDSLAALRARVQMHAAERQANLPNAKADDQIYKKNNPKPDRQAINVQGLNVDYANRKIEEALCETDGPQLRVFTGVGNKGKTLRRSLFGYIQDTLHFDARYDDKDAGVLWITLPSKPDNAGPSTSFTA